MERAKRQTRNWFPEFCSAESVFPFPFDFDCLSLCGWITDYFLLFLDYDTVQESWTRPHTSHTDLPERWRACKLHTPTTNQLTMKLHFYCNLQEYWLSPQCQLMGFLPVLLFVSYPVAILFAGDPVYCGLSVLLSQLQAASGVMDL